MKQVKKKSMWISITRRLCVLVRKFSCVAIIIFSLDVQTVLPHTHTRTHDIAMEAKEREEERLSRMATVYFNK